MIISLMLRFVRYAICGVVASFPLYLMRWSGAIRADTLVLYLSYIIFFILTSRDAYVFSRIYWKKQDFYVGQLFPYAVCVLFSILLYALKLPRLFNVFFMYLRFFECFDCATFSSLLLTHIINLTIYTVARIVGGRHGQIDFEIMLMENTEM